MIVFLLHPKATPYHVGELPDFLFEDDPRPAREQFNERYCSGWHPSLSDRYTLDKADGTLHYPGDPPFLPLAMMTLREEIILVYEHSIVAIVQPDGSFEVDRMD